MSGYGGASLGAAESRRRRGSAQRRVGADPVPAAPSRMTTMAPGGAAIPSSPSLPPPSSPPRRQGRLCRLRLPRPTWIWRQGWQERPIRCRQRRWAARVTDPVRATTAGDGSDGSGGSDDGGQRGR
ncbi:Os04g0267250 [Oryza sativa Japonica Group]|uniref:Os04g0267250 protein n=1 Tax=Oryza sativa subsp. japonica TaxID=39947 RepID=A0A0P0W808_ORYSJ|nr:Os04g0267250 [Oryza sativa Japonica Group]